MTRNVSGQNDQLSESQQTPHKRASSEEPFSLGLINVIWHTSETGCSERPLRSGHVPPPQRQPGSEPFRVPISQVGPFLVLSTATQLNLRLRLEINQLCRLRRPPGGAAGRQLRSSRAQTGRPAPPPAVFSSAGRSTRKVRAPRRRRCRQAGGSLRH